MGGRKDLVHVCVYKPSTRSKHNRNFSFYTGNLPWYVLVPVKSQVHFSLAGEVIL